MTVITPLGGSFFKTSIFLTLLIILNLSSCSHWQGDSAEIVLSFESADRAVYNPNDTASHQKLEHQIILTGVAETLEFSFKGGTFEASVAPGKWNITINSWLDGAIYATGSKDVILKLGRNNETIAMYQPVYWWTWDASTTQEGITYDSTTKTTITFSDYSSCNVTVSGNTANPPGYNWASQVGCNYTATVGKTYKATWKWKADNKPFKNVTLRYAQNNAQDGITDYLYEFDTNTNKLTIPVTEETKMYQFTIPGNCYTNFTFYAGGDTGSFRIWDVRIEEVKTVDVTGNTLADKLNWLYRNAVDGGNYTVKVNGNDSINPGNWLGYGPDNKYGVTITLTGGGTVSLSAPIDNNNNNWCMFGISSNVTLILEQITLKGRSDSKNTLVQVNGRLEMRDGALITGNSSAETSCAVAVYDGYFLMTGGTISGNSSSKCGDAVGVGWGGTFDMRGGQITGNTGFCRGVKVNENGTFNMYNGEISYNHADHGGGGVRLDKTGIFNIYDGTICGNTTNNDGGGVSTDGIFNMYKGDIFENIADGTGGGVSVNEGGIFTMTGGAIYNNINTTIKNTWCGGGVQVDGTFNMSAGEIYGNRANGGGGVNVYTGTFTMTGGEIYGNTVKQCGGGVNVDPEKGRFTKSGGTIYGSDADQTKRNTVTGTWNDNNNGNGHAVSVVSVVNNEWVGIKYHREKTAGSNDNLDSSKSGSAGGWD